jgi:hypothetical protein
MSVPGFVSISKQQAVNNQLRTAVRLYFELGDPLSIHTLVCAAYEILRNVANKKRVEFELTFGQIVSAMSQLAERSEADIFELMRHPQNFLKHANRDSEDALLSFNPQLTEFYLIITALLYPHVFPGPKGPVELDVFFAWFCLQHPQVIKAEVRERFGDRLVNPPLVLDREEFFELAFRILADRRKQNC